MAIRRFVLERRQRRGLTYQRWTVPLLASREEGVGDRWESARQFYRSVYENGGDNRDGNKNGDGREDVGRYKRDVRLYRVHNGVYAGGDESLKCTFVELSKKVKTYPLIRIGKHET
jgi:hypothetical protein